MCDPTYTGLPDATPDPSGALPNAPAAGTWFPAHFQELLRNAHPPLS
jgi:cellulose 1,4-beta-cellobiosidase